MVGTERLFACSVGKTVHSGQVGGEQVRQVPDKPLLLSVLPAQRGGNPLCNQERSLASDGTIIA